MSGIEPSKDYQIRLLRCALHDPALLAKLMQTTKPADWTLPAARFVWCCLTHLITASGQHPTFERLAGYVELRCMYKPAGGEWAREVALCNGSGSGADEDSKYQPRVRALWID